MQQGKQEGMQQGREQGVLIGRIHLCEQRLERPCTPLEELEGEPLEVLRDLAERLEAQLFG